MALYPEFLPMRAVLMALPFSGSAWQETLATVLNCYREMVEAVLVNDDTVELWLLCHDSEEHKHWLEQLSLLPKQRARLRSVTHIPYDDTWIRDYGPLTLSNKGDDKSFNYKSFVFNGWGQKYRAEKDDAVAVRLSDLIGAAVSKSRFVLEGGALEVNSKGVLLANRNCVVDELRNPNMSVADVEKCLSEELGVTRVEWVTDINLTGDDTDGHIDTIARFVADDIIVACGRDANHPDADQLDSLNTQLEAICLNNGWQLYSLPAAEIYSQVDGRMLPATYANVLLCNNTVYVPIYGLEQDATALSVIAKALPSYRTVAVRCEALLEQHGSLHCATMQVG